MSIARWFAMIDICVKTQEKEEGQHIYEINIPEELNLTTQPSGLYYYCGLSKNAKELFKTPAQMRKLSFSEIVSLSSTYSISIFNSCVDGRKIKAAAEEGAAHALFEENCPSTAGFEKMRQKVWKKYFAKGVVEWLKKIFIKLVICFRKYHLNLNKWKKWVETSCDHADNVISRIDKMKKRYIKTAIEESWSAIFNILELSPSDKKELTKSEFERIRKRKFSKVQQDSNCSKKASVKERKLMKIYHDLQKLLFKNSQKKKFSPLWIPPNNSSILLEIDD